MNRFVVTWMQSGIFVLDQQNAHERILFEKFTSMPGEHTTDTQQQLLPQTMNLRPAEAELLTAYLDEFRQSGYNIEPFGKDAFIISGIPAGVPNDNIAGLVESTLENLQTSQAGHIREKRHRFVLGLAKSLSIKRGQKLHPKEQAMLVENLFACNVPEVTPDGKPTVYQVSFDELVTRFK
jgi:DNA mismatch repair protein MutL